MNSKFFTFIKPYLAYIDNGDFFRKPFHWLYTLLAILNIALPLYFLYKLIEIFTRYSPTGEFVILSILAWLGIAVAGWLGFQLWWDRKDKILEVSKGNDDFLAIPSYSHFIQTAGEWIGLWVAIIGFWTSLIMLFSDSVRELFEFFQLGSSSPIKGLIVSPIYGFLIVVGTRVLAEIFRALASIANNTKKG